MDDIILREINDYDIHDLVMELQELDVSLEQEYDAANFLGVAL